MQPQSASFPEPSLDALYNRRDVLLGRLAKGEAALRAKEEIGETGPDYERWLVAWQALLWEYELVCYQIEALERQELTRPVERPPPDAAIDAALRVALRASTITTEVGVMTLARQLAAFADGLPIVGLPTR